MLRIACFIVVWLASPAASSAEQGEGSAFQPDSIEMVLAASWEPAFCATAAGKGRPECESLTAERFDATHFALHGLWPDDLDDNATFPCYCDRGAPVGCERSQRRDHEIDLSAAVESKLSVVMPGMRSGLDRHEWAKHGSCYEDDKTGADKDADPDEYFAEAMSALAALNASLVQELFVDNLGRVLSRQRIEAAVDEAFGTGAAKRVLIRCVRVGGEDVISELRISLKGSISDPADLAALIQAAPPTTRSTNARSCAAGRLIAVGG